MKPSALSATLAIIMGVSLGWITAMMLTPVLWRLEGVFHVELAGHSGPSDWIFYVIWAVILPSLFFLLRQVVLRRR